MASVIIISFLSLMSFADFLRVHWQQAPREDQEGRGDRRQHMPNHAAHADGKEEKDDADLVDETAIDNDIGDYVGQHQPPDLEHEHEGESGEEDISNTLEHRPDEVDGGNASYNVLRSQAAQLRDLALEREARGQATAASRQWTPLNDDVSAAPAGENEGGADDDASPVLPRRVFADANPEVGVEHLDDNNDDIMVDHHNIDINDGDDAGDRDDDDDDDEDEDDDDDDDDEDEDEDEDDEDDHDRPNWAEGNADDRDEVPGDRRPADADQDGVGVFDPMEAVLQDDQNVSVLFCSSLGGFSYCLLHSFSSRIICRPANIGHGN
jgi:hypothetical protein